MMRTPWSWYVLLVVACVVGPYLLHIRPRRPRDWLLITVAIAFLTWLLAGFAFLRAG